MQRSVFFTIIMVVLSACSQTGTPLSPTGESSLVTASLVPSPTITSVPTQSNVQSGQIFVVCENSLSDASRINTVISNSAVGDEIVFSGHCLINETIKLLGDRSYRGTSRTGTVLRQADGANLAALLATDTYLENLEWTGSPVAIRQMTLDGNREMNPQALTDGIILRSWASVIEDMYITDMSQDGIRVAYESANGTKLITSQVNGIISGNFINNSGRYAVYEEAGVTDWYLTENEIAFSGVDGLHLEDVAGWFIESNNIYGVPQTAIHAERLFGTSISDNYIEGFGETEQAGEWYGIYATIQGGDAASTISNNRIFNIGININGPGNATSTYRYLAVIANGNVAVVGVTDNILRGVEIGDEYGLCYIADFHSFIVTSSGNTVTDIKTPRFMDDGVTLAPGY